MICIESWGMGEERRRGLDLWSRGKDYKDGGMIKGLDMEYRRE